MAVDFLAEIIQLVYAKTAFQVSAAINAGRGMALEVDQVAAVAFAFSVPEVVLAATYHGGQRGERRNVPPQIAAVGRVVAVGLDDHGHGLPAYIRASALFQYVIARMRRLAPRRFGIDVCGLRREQTLCALTKAGER